MTGATLPAWSDELQGRVDKWLKAQPQQRIALTFVDRQRHAGHYALMALEQETLAAAYGARESQVVAVKLQWWVEELSAAGVAGAHHPLTEVLFADERAGRIDAATWSAPTLAAIAQLDTGTAPDFQAQLDTASRLHGALAALETRWWYGDRADPARAARVATLSYLLQALQGLSEAVDRDCLPLPMARLAQHGLSREQLRHAGAARDQAIKDQLGDLLRGLRDSERLPGPLSVFRAVELRASRRAASRALQARDSHAALLSVAARPGAWDTLQVWRTAMAWRRADPWLSGPAQAGVFTPGTDVTGHARH